ncbi:hypothetical protein Bca4012_072674 [Brassica carinata]
MTNPQVLSGELKASRHRKTVVTHVLRSWEARNVKKGGDLMGVYLVLLDEKVQRDSTYTYMGIQPHNQHEQVITQSDNESLLPAFQATPLASTDNMNTSNTALYTFSFIKLEPDGASQTSNTRTTRQKSSFMKTCLIHNKPGAQYIVGMDEYFLYKNIDKAQSRT